LHRPAPCYRTVSIIACQAPIVSVGRYFSHPFDTLFSTDPFAALRAKLVDFQSTSPLIPTSRSLHTRSRIVQLTSSTWRKPCSSRLFST
jgi:hypothetical protein